MLLSCAAASAAVGGGEQGAFSAAEAAAQDKSKTPLHNKHRVDLAAAPSTQCTKHLCNTPTSRARGGMVPHPGGLPANIAFVKHIFKRFSRKGAKSANLRYISEIQNFYFEHSPLWCFWTASVFHRRHSIVIRYDEAFLRVGDLQKGKTSVL